MPLEEVGTLTPAQRPRPPVAGVTRDKLPGGCDKRATLPPAKTDRLYLKNRWASSS